MTHRKLKHLSKTLFNKRISTSKIVIDKNNCLVANKDLCKNAAKGRCNYGVDTVITKNQATQKFYIHFFIDNSNVYISLYTLSCPN